MQLLPYVMTKALLYSIIFYVPGTFVIVAICNESHGLFCGSKDTEVYGWM